MKSCAMIFENGCQEDLTRTSSTKRRVRIKQNYFEKKDEARLSQPLRNIIFFFCSVYFSSRSYECLYKQHFQGFIYCFQVA